MPITTHARAMRQALTPAEAILWSVLRTSPLDHWHFRRQVAFRELYIADFASHAALLVIEADGCSHDMTGDGDAQRTAWFETQGYRVVRFTNADVMRDRQSVYLTLCALVPEGEPPPRSRKGASRPPHSGEGV